MDLSYVSVFVYFILTIIYFTFFKPKPTLQDVQTPQNYNTFSQKTYRNLTIYFVILLTIQFFMNAAIVVNKCGGNSANNFYLAFKYTFFPWIFIYGIMIVVLVAFPGFKSAFSDVLGYAYVSNKVNILFSHLLVKPDIDENMQKVSTDGNKRELQNTADAILKIFGNLSILVNKIVPENFENFWKILTPLMKDDFKNGAQGQTLDELKTELLDLVVVRENIGEMVWYFYTAILIMVIVQFYIGSNACLSDSETMQANYTQFLQEEQQLKDANDLNNQIVYNVKQ